MSNYPDVLPVRPAVREDGILELVEPRVIHTRRCVELKQISSSITTTSHHKVCDTFQHLQWWFDEERFATFLRRKVCVAGAHNVAILRHGRVEVAREEPVPSWRNGEAGLGVANIIVSIDRDEPVFHVVVGVTFVFQVEARDDLIVRLVKVPELDNLAIVKSERVVDIVAPAQSVSSVDVSLQETILIFDCVPISSYPLFMWQPLEIAPFDFLHLIGTSSISFIISLAAYQHPCTGNIAEHWWESMAQDRHVWWSSKSSTWNNTR